MRHAAFMSLPGSPQGASVRAFPDNRRFDIGARRTPAWVSLVIFLLLCRDGAVPAGATAQERTTVPKNVSGTYSSELGTVTLIQTGPVVQGYWSFQGSRKGEIESGVLEGDTLILLYRQGKETGTAVFTWSPSLSGKWEGSFQHDSGTAGAWNLTKAAGATPAPQASKLQSEDVPSAAGARNQGSPPEAGLGRGRNPAPTAGAPSDPASPRAAPAEQPVPDLAPPLGEPGPQRTRKPSAQAGSGAGITSGSLAAAPQDQGLPKAAAPVPDLTPPLGASEPSRAVYPPSAAGPKAASAPGSLSAAPSAATTVPDLAPLPPERAHGAGDQMSLPPGPESTTAHPGPAPTSSPGTAKPPAASTLSAVAAQAAATLKELSARGERALQSEDKKERGAVKKELEKLERALTDAKLASCVECRDQLAWVYYYQTRYGARKDFEELRDFAVRSLRQSPDDPVLLYLLGNAALSDEQTGVAISSFKRFLALPGTKPEWQEQARTALDNAQRAFLVNWWRQPDFYGDKKANSAGQAEVDQRRKAAEQMQAQLRGDFQWTPEKEIQLGAQALSSVKDMGQPSQDPEIQKYIAGIVMKLLDKSPGPPFQYRIDLLESDAVNAFAVPGAVMVNKGLLRFTENEAELAAVLAHELGHNYGHHMARMLEKKGLAQMGINMLGAALAGQSAAAQTAGNIGANVFASVVLLAYSRYEEREADLYGTHIAFNAGYNPTYSSALLLRMFQANPKQPVKFLSKHPPDPDRIDYLTRHLEAFPLGKEMQIDSAEFQKMKQKVGAAAAPKTGNKSGEPALKP